MHEWTQNECSIYRGVIYTRIVTNCKIRKTPVIKSITLKVVERWKFNSPIAEVRHMTDLIFWYFFPSSIPIPSIPLLLYHKCKAFCTFVGIGSSHLLNRKRVCLPPSGEGAGGPNSDDGTDTLVLYVLYFSCSFNHCSSLVVLIPNRLHVPFGANFFA
jgi:hypothetical protein